MEQDRTQRRERRAEMMAKKTSQMKEIREESERLISGLTQIGDLEERKIRQVAELNMKIEAVRASMRQTVDDLNLRGLTDEGIAAIVGVETAEVKAIRKAGEARAQ